MSSEPAPARGTLRYRLLTLLALPLLALLVGSLAFDYHIAFEPAARAYDHALADDAVALAGRIRYLDARLQVDLPTAAEAVLRTDRSDEEFLAVQGPDGRLLWGDADLAPEPPRLGHNPSLSDGAFRGHQVRKATYRFESAGGPVTVTVAETTRKRERAGSRILAAMLLPNILLILATLALVYVGVRRGLAPLNQLSEAIGKRTPHDLSPLPQHDVPAEAKPLVDAMDGLIEDVRSASAAQQVFLANAAHQLKTPLAGLQAQLELHAAELPPAYEQRARRLLVATHRLGHMTHQLLALARSGPEANLAQEKRPVDLARLLEDSASAWYDHALRRGIDLGFEAEAATVAGSEWMLREMLGNLIDNALRYAPEGGAVTVRSGVDGEEAFVEVEDNGPGIPADQRQRVFERFYRIDETVSEGSGLGLAIVKEVADRHQATVALLPPSSATGTRIRVRFSAGMSADRPAGT